MTEEVSAATRKFSAQLHRVVSAEKKDSNLVCSPLSVSAVLTMALAGAAGNTAAQMRKALNLGKDDEKTFAGFKELMKTLVLDPPKKVKNWMGEEEEEGCELSMANRVFPHERFPLAEAFVRVAADCFGAGEPKGLAFGADPAGAAKEINGFVERETMDKIKDIVSADMFSDDTALVLVNAIYFKGKWLSPFPSHKTNKTQDFFVTPDNPVKTAIMHTDGGHFHYRSDKVKAEMLEMPFKGGQMSMVFILPFEKTPLEEVEANLVDFEWNEFYEKGGNLRFDDVAIPKFRVETTLNLIEPLKKLGITEAFDPSLADFSKMSSFPPSSSSAVHVSRVVHKAFVDVDEEGCEAAAATALSVDLCSLSVQSKLPPRTFVCDRPFSFVLVRVDESVKLPTFVGKVRNPSKK